MNELVSIIVPIYKVEAYIKKCISSILNQTYGNFELLLIDDGERIFRTGATQTGRDWKPEKG